MARLFASGCFCPSYFELLPVQIKQISFNLMSDNVPLSPLTLKWVKFGKESIWLPRKTNG